jgi:hypothetical protein
VVAALAMMLALAPAALGQRSVQITGDRLSGFVLPIEPLTGDIRLRALRGTAWTIDDTKRLLLEGDVTVSIAGRELSSRTAVIWLNRIPSAEGLINQIAVYFDEGGQPTRRAGMGAEGRNLLVTASARGDVSLSVAALDEARPRASGIVRRGEQRLADHLRRLVAEPPLLEDQPKVDIPPSPEAFVPVPGGTVRPRDVALPERVELPPEPRILPLLPPRGIVRWSAEELEFTRGESENVIVASGSLLVQYFALDRKEDYSTLTLSAERGVIFVKPGSVEQLARELDADLVEGIYLEGGVWVSVDDGDYIARAPKAYYDFRTQQAVMVDAVLRTYVRESRLPVYARARELRQIALNQWQAREVKVSTSEFLEPHLALGSQKMTVTRRPMATDPEQRETYLVGEDNALRVGGVPVVGLPRFAGTVDDVALRSVAIGTQENDGVAIETKWDLYTVLGREKPDNVEAELKVDTFTERGPGVGVGVDYRFDAGDAAYALDLYGMYDDGEDRTSSGRDVDQGPGPRGVALWEQRIRLPRGWSLQTQGSWISDETFITARREDDFRERREYETSAYLKNQQQNAALDLLVQYELNDFLSNDYLLASRGTQVDKLPELTYRRYGDGLLDGSVTYSGETRLSRMRFAFEQHSPEELGIRGRAFDTPDDEPIASALRARGLSSQYVNRFDTRHEIALPRQVGAFQITPFGVGRLTAYDDDFEDFSSDADNSRLYGAAGVRINTQLQHVDNTATNRILDINRIRHIVEPSVTLWYGYASVDQEDLPNYDPEVESLGTGAAIRLGVRNTLQTQRGGPGRWRSVDFLTIDVDAVFNSNDADKESPTARFFDYRPEYSQAGDHVRGVLVWLLSDSVAVVGEQTIDIDESAIARGSIGAELRHSRDLSTYVEYRYIDASDNQLLGVSWDYALTPLYHVRLRPQWDFQEDQFRSISVQVTREFPDFELTLQFRHDEIRDDTSIGASIDLVEF